MGLRGSQKAAFGETDGLAAGDDQVVEDPDVDERQRLLEAPSDQLVGLAGLCHAARVRVREDDRSGGFAGTRSD